MKTHRNIRLRIRANSKRKYRRMYEYCGACRFVWNYFVGQLKDDYANNGVCDPGYYSLGKRFTQLKKDQVEWLNNYSANIIKSSLRPIETQYKKFFTDPKNNGLPKFKSKWGDSPSFPIYFGHTATLNGNWLHIQRLGRVKLIGRNPYPHGIAKSGTIKQEHGKWYAYLKYEVDIEEKTASGKAVGLDRNVGQVALSDGTMYRVPDTARIERRKKKYQKQMSRRRKPDRNNEIAPSNRYLKVRRLYQKQAAKIRHLRNDWQHQVSSRIADEYDVVYIEDLNIKQMTRSAKGDLENPGQNVTAKSGLNKAILNTGWYELERKLSYKTTLHKVAPHFTSQMCHMCGVKDKQSRRSQSKFVCTSCGHSDNADINAAKNILASGIRDSLNGRRDSRVTSTVKRQKYDQLTLVN